jgi:hypothetical protein
MNVNGSDYLRPGHRWEGNNNNMDFEEAGHEKTGWIHMYLAHRVQ